MKNKIGITLFVLYFIQDFFLLKISYLEHLQSIELYKKWSGLLLLILILSQWYISALRANKKISSSKKQFYVNLHKLIGVLLPLFFYFHSTSIGFGMLFVLSVVFFISIFLGFINTENFVIRFPNLFNWWLMLHILFSAIVLVLSFIHVWQVFYFN